MSDDAIAELLARYSPEQLEIAADAEECERDLARFYRASWDVIDPDPYNHSFHVDAIADHLMAVTDGQIKRLLINIPPRFGKTNLVSIAWPDWTWTQKKIGPLSGPQVKFLCVSYGSQLVLDNAMLAKRLIKSEWFQKRWSSRFQIMADKDSNERFDTDKGGSRFSAGFEGGTLGRGGGVKIIDDPHKVGEADSDLVREGVIKTYKEALSSRVTDPRTSAEVIIMQRLHEYDLSGHVLEKGGFVHLCLPMEYEPDRHCFTVVSGNLFWEDPRGKDENGQSLFDIDTNEMTATPRDAEAEEVLQEKVGELLWPERFTPEVVEAWKDDLEAYACTPAESPVLMRDLSLRPISEVQPGDDVIGFTTDTTPADGSKIYRRRVLISAQVKAVHKFVAPVVKITMDSGEVIRCTPDHKWWSDRAGDGHGNGKKRRLYRCAGIGTNLVRVCPPRLPIVAGEDCRRAGWLSGFFDGEGSVSLCRRGYEGGRSSAIISFYQGAGRNLPLCEKLERELTHFGFRFNVNEFIRDDRKISKSTHMNRHYRILDTSLPTIQRFLHVVQPNKWKERLEHAALKANFVIGVEKIKDIKPDGEEPVYALETTSGNYIVWGFASSNSAGQLQQSPAPRGGGIIKFDWWRLWREKTFPNFGTVVASLDTALKEKESADFNALTIWGAFPDDKGFLQIMLKDAWRGRCSINELVETVRRYCVKHQVDILLIEDKTRGHDTAGELRRMYAGNSWSTRLLQVKGDKVNRANAVAGLWSGRLRKDPKSGIETWDGGIIWAPGGEGVEYDWVRPVLDEFSSFPMGKHDDFVDSGTMAVQWMRTNGVALYRQEFEDEEMSKRSYRKPMSPLYDV